MKKTIRKYYGFNYIDNYREIGNKILFKIDNNEYVFEPIYDSTNFNSICDLLGNDCDEIIPNIYNDIYTKINNIDYALIKKRKETVNIINSIVSSKYIFGERGAFDKFGWIDLWQKKLDYYEYQQEHIKYYKCISESFNYYLGMGETAISYINYNVGFNKIPIVLCHKRINREDYDNPFNMTFDYRARDISGYLKYLFLNKKYFDFDFVSFFKQANLNRLDLILVYGRLLFPSFYFDRYDDIINNNSDPKKIKSIISRSEEYEYFLKMIYTKVNSIVAIPRVDWLN